MSECENKQLQERLEDIEAQLQKERIKYETTQASFFNKLEAIQSPRSQAEGKNTNIESLIILVERLQEQFQQCGGFNKSVDNQLNITVN